MVDLEENKKSVHKGFIKSFKYSSSIFIKDVPWITEDQYKQYWSLFLDSECKTRLAQILKAETNYHDDSISGLILFLINKSLLIDHKEKLYPDKKRNEWLDEVKNKTKELRLLLNNTSIERKNEIEVAFKNQALSNNNIEFEFQSFIKQLTLLNEFAEKCINTTLKNKNPTYDKAQQRYFVKMFSTQMKEFTGKTHASITAEITSILFNNENFSEKQVNRILRNT